MSKIDIWYLEKMANFEFGCRKRECIMRIGIIGGSFNPPHKMHKELGLMVLRNNLVDKVIYVPTGDKYPKNDLIEGIHRFQMLKLMCKDNLNLEVSDIEIKTGKMATYQTINYFKKLYSTDQIYFILGSDLYAELNTWKHSQYLKEQCYFILIDRIGFHHKLDLTDKTIICKENIKELSSTYIRNNLNQAIREELLDKSVIDYIKKHKLYCHK